MLRKAALVVSIAAALATAGCGDDDEADSGSFFYLQGASAGTLDTRGGILTLNGASPSVAYFSDRPDRTAGQTSFAAFRENWEQLFGEDPPNAAVQDLAIPREVAPAVIELLEPPQHESGRTVSYRVRVIDPPEGLPELVRFGEVSLLIDNGEAVGSANVGVGCNINDPDCGGTTQSRAGCNWGDPHDCPPNARATAGCDPFVDPRCNGSAARSSGTRDGSATRTP